MTTSIITPEFAEDGARALANHHDIISDDQREDMGGAWRDMKRRHASVSALLDNIEGSYVAALNSILAAADDNSPDAHRWRGHAEALRQIASLLRISLDLPAVEYGSAEWRTANGVYIDEQVAKFRALSNGSTKDGA